MNRVTFDAWIDTSKDQKDPNMQLILNWFRKQRRLRTLWSRARRAGLLPLVFGLLLAVLFLHATLFYWFEKEAWKAEHLTWFKAFWTTMTTFTTVGYGDFYPKTNAGRWTTMLLGYAVGLSLFAWLASEAFGTLLDRIERRRHGMLKVNANDHLLIINFPGIDKVRLLIEQLRSSPKTKDQTIILINNQIDEMPFKEELLYFVKGDITDPATFESASIHNARDAIILAAQPDDPNTDAITVAIVSIIESINSKINTVAECVYKKHLPLFRHVNCDNIVFSGDFMMKMLVQEIQDAGTSNIISTLLDRKEGNELYSVALPDEAKGWSFRELHSALLDLQALPIGYIRDQESIVNPPKNEPLQSDDRLLFIATDRPSSSELQRHISTHIDTTKKKKNK